MEALRAAAKSSRQAKSNTLSVNAAAIAFVPSVEPVSTITISSTAPCTLRRQRASRSSSFLTIIHSDSSTGSPPFRGAHPAPRSLIGYARERKMSSPLSDNQESRCRFCHSLSPTPAAAIRAAGHAGGFQTLHAHPDAAAGAAAVPAAATTVSLTRHADRAPRVRRDPSVPQARRAFPVRRDRKALRASSDPRDPPVPPARPARRDSRGSSDPQARQVPRALPARPAQPVPPARRDSRGSSDSQARPDPPDPPAPPDPPVLPALRVLRALRVQPAQRALSAPPARPDPPALRALPAPPAQPARPARSKRDLRRATRRARSTSPRTRPCR